MKWSQVSLDYLTNGAGIEFLANQKLDENTPLYNERELSHMLDVKNLIQLMLIVWPLIGIVILVTGVISMRIGWLPQFWLAVSRGGWAAVGLIAAILVVYIQFLTLVNRLNRTFSAAILGVSVFRYTYPIISHALLAGCIYCDGCAGIVRRGGVRNYWEKTGKYGLKQRKMAAEVVIFLFD